MYDKTGFFFDDIISVLFSTLASRGHKVFITFTTVVFLYTSILPTHDILSCELIFISRKYVELYSYIDEW